jgi:hypothetical protein
VHGDLQVTKYDTRFTHSFTTRSTSLSTYSLYCIEQVRVHGDLQVTKYDRFWGEGDDETKDRSFSMPFAELEFLLDSNKHAGPTGSLEKAGKGHRRT